MDTVDLFLNLEKKRKEKKSSNFISLLVEDCLVSLSLSEIVVRFEDPSSVAVILFEALVTLPPPNISLIYTAHSGCEMRPLRGARSLSLSLEPRLPVLVFTFVLERIKLEERQDLPHL